MSCLYDSVIVASGGPDEDPLFAELFGPELNMNHDQHDYFHDPAHDPVCLPDEDGRGRNTTSPLSPHTSPDRLSTPFSELLNDNFDAAFNADAQAPWYVPQHRAPTRSTDALESRQTIVPSTAPCKSPEGLSPALSDLDSDDWKLSLPSPPPVKPDPAPQSRHSEPPPAPTAFRPTHHRAAHSESTLSVELWAPPPPRGAKRRLVDSEDAVKQRVVRAERAGALDRLRGAVPEAYFASVLGGEWKRQRTAMHNVVDAAARYIEEAGEREKGLVREVERQRRVIGERERAYGEVQRLCVVQGRELEVLRRAQYESVSVQQVMSCHGPVAGGRRLSGRALFA